MNYKEVIMLEFLMRVITCIVVGILCIVGLMNSSNDILMYIFGFGSIISFISLIRYILKYFLLKIRKKNPSPLVFVYFEIFLGIAVSLYALYDLKTSTGWLPGIRGYLLLVYVVPVFGILGLIDFILWLSKKKR